MALSGWTERTTNIEERPLSGWDVGIAGQVPRLEDLRVSLSAFRWEQDTENDKTGLKPICAELDPTLAGELKNQGFEVFQFVDQIDETSLDFIQQKHRFNNKYTEMIHSFLMIGQSNMAGRGNAKEVPAIFDEHIKMQRNGLWQIMSEPINFDRPTSGVGLASSFAAAWRLDNEDDEIGLIPCADGGTSVDDWAAGGALFENAVSQAKLAQRTSEIKGILWHQGENDCSVEKASQYQEKFSAIIDALRQQLNISEVPLIIGGLGDFLPDGILGQYFAHYSLVNKELERFAESHKNCYFVTAKGLTANLDGIHFNARSQRLLGIRYYHAYHDLKQVLDPLNHEESILNTIYNRPYTRTEKIKILENEFALGNIDGNT
jgi:hypothetical protein